MYKISTVNCSKCGHEVTGATYIQSGDMEIDSEKTQHAGNMKRVCGFCGYYWYESSADNIHNAATIGGIQQPTEEPKN